MEQAHEAKDQERAGVWEDRKPVAAVEAAALGWAPEEPASARTVGKKLHMN